VADGRSPDAVRAVPGVGSAAGFRWRRAVYLAWVVGIESTQTGRSVESWGEEIRGILSAIHRDLEDGSGGRERNA